MGCGLSIFSSEAAAPRFGDPRRSDQRGNEPIVDEEGSLRNSAVPVPETSLVVVTTNANTTSHAAFERRRSIPRVGLTEPLEWPPWLVSEAGDVIKDWKPRRANTFEKIKKIGQGTYSNVYKARDLISGKVVALKKVRIDDLEPESIKFMAREILILRKLDHPNVLKLEGLVTSRMSSSLYLVFEYMEHDLSGLAAHPGAKFSLPQIKCYMKQLFLGLEYCHKLGVLHRDIKGSNLLVDGEGNLKIADFGLACFYDSNVRKHMTNRVVTLWYRPPELLLGATIYGVSVDLWSAGCILAELLAEKPILPGRTEVEQLLKIFKLCGSPSDVYWQNHKLPNATLFKSQPPCKRIITETFKSFPPQSLPLICTLLSLEPDDRGTATSALSSEFFWSEPLPCEPSSLPKYPPSKELDVRLRDEEARRQKSIVGKSNADGVRKARHRDRTGQAMPAPEANAELQTILDRRRLAYHNNQKSKSEKFPPPHQDGSVGFPSDRSQSGTMSFGPGNTSFTSSVCNSESPASSRSNANSTGRRRVRSTKFLRELNPFTTGPSMEFFSKK